MKPLARGRLAAAAVPLLVAAAASACHSSEMQAEPSPATQSAPAPVPTDRLAEGELVEGTTRVFGVLLPRDLSVTANFGDVAYARGTVAMRAVAGYLRDHTQGGSEHKEGNSVRFDQVTAIGASAPPLQIRVDALPSGTQVVFHDQTPPELPPDYAERDEAARWRSVGLTTSGKIIDWTHLN
jgi:hypothetical protein